MHKGMHSRRLLVFFMGAALCVAGGIAPVVAFGSEASPPDRAPRAVKRVDAIYPFSLSRAGASGSVTVSFTVNTQGRVADVSVVSSTRKEFEAPAITAISKWEFEPGIRNGKPVAARMQVSLTFTLEDETTEPRQWSVTKPAGHDSMPPEFRWLTAPEPLKLTSPVYPFEALKAGRPGTARIRYVVGPGGSVVDLEVVSASAPEFGAAALAAIETWTFKPATREEGTACMALLGETFEFLPGGSSSVVVTNAARAIIGAEAAELKVVVAMRDLDGVPERVSVKQPVFPRSQVGKADKGTAMIEFYIGPRGKVLLPRIVSASEPEFGYAAAQAVSEWSFHPPKAGGLPVITQARIPIRFEAP
jgi:TonB family protein